MRIVGDESDNVLREINGSAEASVFKLIPYFSQVTQMLPLLALAPAVLVALTRVGGS